MSYTTSFTGLARWSRLGFIAWACLMVMPWGCDRPSRSPMGSEEYLPTSRPTSRSAGKWTDSIPQAPYRLQIGDSVAVKFQHMASMNDEVTVRPDGMISLMPVDDVPAAGLTPAELDKILTERYAKIINQPDLTVIVRKFATQRAFIGGEVRQPGVIPLEASFSVLNGIMAAGGPMPTAAMDQVLLIRRGEGNRCYVIKLNLKSTMDKGVDDALLCAFDVVYVPRTIISNIDLFVEQYINQVVPRGLGFQFLYNLNPQVEIVGEERSNILFSRTR